MIEAIVKVIVALSSRAALLVAAGLIALSAWAAKYDASHFAMDSSTDNLVSRNATWRLHEKKFDDAFPQFKDQIVAVVDGATSERAAMAVDALEAALRKNPKLFPGVRRPDGGSFFAHNGLLFLSESEVRGKTAAMIAAQPFLGALAADPSLRGIMTSLSTALLGVEHGDTKLAQLQRPMTAFGDTLSGVLDGRPKFLSWRTLIAGGKPDKRELRRFIEIRPKLDYSALMPGRAATDEIRRVAETLGLTPENGVRVRLTGNVPMNDDQFATLADHAALLGALMMAGVLSMLWFAVRSTKTVCAIVVTLACGLALTAALGLRMAGAFDIISIAFIPLFVGLGVDFSIQFCVRYRAERHAHDNLHRALVAAGAGIGPALTLAACAIAVGFFAFLPTDYAGVANLGFVAGTGMIVTYGLSLTLLPALLAILRPGGEPEEIGFMRLGALDGFIARHPRFVVLVAAAMGIAALIQMPQLSFDFNPLDLQNPKVESVATALELMKDPETSPYTADILAPNPAAAEAIAARLRRSPEVAQVLTLESFVPGDQDSKLAAVADAASLLDSTLNPFFPAPAPSDAELVQSLKATASALRAAAAKGDARSSAAALRLAGVLERLAAAPQAVRARADEMLVPGMRVLLEETRAALQPARVTLQTLPDSLKSDWVSRAGLYRVNAAPKGDARDNAVLARFASAVLAIAPDATGPPVIIRATGRTIVSAFIEAGVLSFLALFALLWLWLRELRYVLLALGPLVLAGVLTLASAIGIGMPLNYANIIALPLLFGIGVAFDVYFVVAWRSGARELLRSPLTRAIVLSAGTTTCGFGMLSLSSHPGTASMGTLLFLSLFWVLAVVLLLLPALLRLFGPRAVRR